MQNKPTLVMAKRTAHEGTRRILSSLEHGALTLEPERVARWKLNGWTIGLCILLLAMTVLAWKVHQAATRTMPYQEGAAPNLGAARTGPVVAHATATPNMPATSQAAAIINDAPVQVEIIRRADLQGTPPPQPSGNLAGAAARGAGTPPDTAAKIVPKAASMANLYAQAGHGPYGHTRHQASPAAPHAAQHNPPGTDPLATAHAEAPSSPVQADTTPAHGVPARARKATAIVPVATSDTDVTLLTALVAHANHPAVVTAERSRDIVERGNGDSTADLLRRCKQLGLIEGMLCRSRICSGRWENDPGCRTPGR
jgi:cytoskeletal protein RodZ